MEKIRFLAPCLFGVESAVAGEARRLGLENVSARDGRVYFEGGPPAVAEANIWLRTAERVLIVMGEFRAETFDQLFEGTRALPWERWISRKAAFPVSGHSVKSKLFSIPDCQAIIKKAIVERLRQRYRTAWFEETAEEVRVRFNILGDVATLSVDTSGEGLHKRGYREKSNQAPIRETLAAAILSFCRYSRAIALYDPFCGSGTFLVEAAMYARNIAPGLRRGFAAEKWSSLDQAVWRAAREKALGAMQEASPVIEGSDIDPEAVRLTLENAAKAGVGDIVRAVVRNVADISLPAERGVLVCNPPYGERMLDRSEAERLYALMGRTFARFGGWNLYVLTPDEEFERFFGRKADKKRKLYNGMIRCDLFQYLSGSSRKRP